jgi:hypothetical protein
LNKLEREGLIMFIKADKTNALRKLEKVTEYIPSPDVLDFFGELSDAYSEDRITKREIAKIEAQRDVLLSAITKKYKLYHKVFEELFAERKVGIAKSFEIIDRGVMNNDKELISMGLHSLSKIVSSSPFANITELSNALENNKTIEI